MPYSYEDFEKAAGGMLGQFSRYDLDLARQYPEFGMSILSLKKDYQNAQTDEQRLLANEAANRLRSSYGNYTGGGDGSRYISNGMYENRIDDALNRLGSFGSFSYGDAPTYDNHYAELQRQLLDNILSRPDFTWSKETDPNWASYKKQYLREGERATANALAQASAASGGRPSSFAVNAATQAGDYYATKLSDKIPELYQQAYDRYRDEYARKLQDLNAVNQQEQMDYAKYQDQLGQFNTDRQFAYNQHLGDYNMLQAYLDNLRGQSETDYSRGMDAQNARMAADQQAFDNALALYQLYGYVPDGGANALGLPAGTPTADRAYREFQMQQAAAKLAGGSGGSSGGSRRRSSGGNSTGSSAGGTNAAIEAFNNGDYSDAVIAQLVAMGYTEQDLRAAGYNGNYFDKGHGGELSVQGYGMVTWADAEKLEALGLIEMAGRDKSGNPIYRRTVQGREQQRTGPSINLYM